MLPFLGADPAVLLPRAPTLVVPGWYFRWPRQLPGCAAGQGAALEGGGALRPSSHILVPWSPVYQPGLRLGEALAVPEAALATCRAQEAGSRGTSPPAGTPLALPILVGQSGFSQAL